MKQILFISYDGLTDPLGQSQILPYMIGLSKAGYKVHILSCEKPSRLEQFIDVVSAITKLNNIVWSYTLFTSSPPILAKMLDFRRLKNKAIQIVKREKIDIVHCRSYVTSNIGVYLKRRFGCKYIFDMRGFWADERKDSGAWDTQRWFYRALYNSYKNKERKFILNADYIIALTSAAKLEIESWDYCQNKFLKIQVIPCCADMEHFSLATPMDKEIARERLGFSADDFVVSYLGSIGTWYLLDEMLQLFKLIKQRYQKAKFLFVTHSLEDLILSKLNTCRVSENDIKIVSASRNEVPVFMKASDINLSFIKPSYSKMASSPTKNAEVLAMGIPIILNRGIGDVEEMIQSGAVYMLSGFTTEDLVYAVDSIPELLQSSTAQIRLSVAEEYSLENGIKKYLAVYNNLS
ncbi:MAG: glycosyltransferase [Burkholderiales bacterium]|nr:glycosyltransferase [Burkholderiales bacterium]